MNISVNECLPHYVGGVGNYTGNYLGGGGSCVYYVLDWQVVCNMDICFVDGWVRTWM